MTLYLGSRLKTGYIMLITILNTSEVASVCNYVLDWDVGKTNTKSRGDVLPTSPPPVSLDPAEGASKCLHSTSRSHTNHSFYP